MLKKKLYNELESLINSIIQNSKNTKIYLPHELRNLNLKVNSRFCLKLEFTFKFESKY